MSETRAAARRRLADRFRAAGIDSADLDARVLVCAVAGIDHAAFVRDPDRPLGAAEAERLAEVAARRVAREPVSRILGRREFWGLDLAVSPAVLDPRPETEGLIASALDAIGGRRSDPLRILDLGTGSGAILAALLVELPGAFGIGLDRSPASCAVARGNFAALGLASRAAVVCGDWSDPLDSRFDLVVSNPPYIATADLGGLERDVRDYDPLAALDGGADGFEAYRALVPRLADLLLAEGVAAFECGTGQGARIASMLEAEGLPGAAVYRDLAGHDRVVVATRGGSGPPGPRRL